MQCHESTLFETIKGVAGKWQDWCSGLVSDPRDKPPVTGNVLQAGAHEYQFTYVLPRSLPSSFESQDLQFKGRVHYILRAKLDTPDESVRTNCDKMFLVLSALDLNKEPKAGVSTRLWFHYGSTCPVITDILSCRKVSSCGVRSKCVAAVVSQVLFLVSWGWIARGMFPGKILTWMPSWTIWVGEKLVLHMSPCSRWENYCKSCCNHHTQKNVMIHVFPSQIVHYHAHGTSRMSTSDIFRISGGKIKCGDNAFYHDIIHIPPLPPSRLDGCRLVDIDYIITVCLQGSLRWVTQIHWLIAHV